ncbi:DUF3422 domain-containing protein [Youhaiella tibetensis]|uniref:DUF3422 domain-containing protein n=2 Tax=Paradevosia tibetensis TaxID=1447062 RepID=A0A5B9DK21_9HYPH|nr:DUF3422 domain-containing protein [Youhaiella tibetensis]
MATPIVPATNLSLSGLAFLHYGPGFEEGGMTEQLTTDIRLAGFERDPRWQAVSDESNRRPPLPLPLPGTLTHLVFRTDDIGSDRHYEHVHALLFAWQAKVDLDRPDQVLAQTDALSIKWERHTEFCSLTVLTREGVSPPVEPDFPQTWRETAPAPLLLALRVTAEATTADLARLLTERQQRGPEHMASLVNGGEALVETDFKPGTDGFTHIAILTSDPSHYRAGRLAQRLTEVETYRLLTLYSWPDVQSAGPKLNEIDRGLMDLTEELSDPKPGADSEFLKRLTALAGELERVTAQTHFRLNASSAYYDLVQRRLEDLREDRVSGAQRISSFVNRRLNPAARTYRSILNRQREMSDRVARTSQLLRSRVDVELAEQNQAILRSMNQRSEQSYLLQQTVEGLSVVAVSYYALGILTYVLGIAAAYDHAIDPKLWAGILAPVVVILTWFGIRHLRERVHKGGH